MIKRKWEWGKEARGRTEGLLTAQLIPIIIIIIITTFGYSVTQGQKDPKGTRQPEPDSSSQTGAIKYRICSAPK